MTKTFLSIVMLASLCMGQSTSRPAALPQIQSPSLRIEFDKQMHSRVVARFNGREVPLGAFSASETLKGSERSWYSFALESQKRDRVSDAYGGGEKLTLTGTSGSLRKTLSVIIYDDFPNLAVFDVSYTNTGKSQLKILEWNNNRYTIDAQRGSAKIPFWSFQSGSYEQSSELAGPTAHWILPAELSRHERQRLRRRHSDC